MSPTPEHRAVVIDTTPLIALAVATDGLEVLKSLYARVVVPFEVRSELLAAGKNAIGIAEFERASWLECGEHPTEIMPVLANSLDRGEASVIQTALNETIGLVCIDETVGRRLARLSGLALTGTIGILVKAHRQGYPIVMREAIDKMRRHGIWLSDEVIRFALAQAR